MVPSGEIKWQLPWDQMLTAELAYHDRKMPNMPPDGVNVHRKYRGPDDQLVYDVRCRGSTPQAQQLHAAIVATRSKYYLEPLRAARGFKVQAVLAAEQSVSVCACVQGARAHGARVWG